MKLNLWLRIRFCPLVVAIRRLLPNSLINSFKHWPTGMLANFLYGFPSRKLKVIGVTGTDGKTTTATYLHHLLEKSGFKVALISTVTAKLGKKEIDTGFHVTAPDHFALQQLVKKIAHKGYEYLILEVTSHGLAQHRFWGIKFYGGIVTNITQDHLDYHGSWLQYLAAKAKMFSQTRFAVLNKEDKSYRFLLSQVKGKVITYGLTQGDFNLNSLPFSLPVEGDFNKLNLMAALTAANFLGIELEEIRRALQTLPKIRGRLEFIQENPFAVVVDFAHTPNALQQALLALRKRVAEAGRLIAVFGCAGERDKGRRKMGKVSAESADITIITAEDPRTEGTGKISADIARWARKGKAKEIRITQLYRRAKKVFVRIDDRGEALTWAIGTAQKGDVVGIFGKGHERSICFGTKEYPWSDQDAVKKILSKKFSWRKKK